MKGVSLLPSRAGRMRTACLTGACAAQLCGNAPAAATVRCHGSEGQWEACIGAPQACREGRSGAHVGRVARKGGGLPARLPPASAGGLGSAR